MTTTIYNGNTRQAMHVRSIAYCLRVLTNTAKRRRTTASVTHVVRTHVVRFAKARA